MSENKKSAPKHEHDKHLIDGSALLNMLKAVLPSLMENIKHQDSQMAPVVLPSMPFGNEVDDSDFDQNDPMIKMFNDDLGGCHGVVKIIKLNPMDAMEKISSSVNNMEQIRTANRLTDIRKAYELVKGFAADNSGKTQVEAVKLLDKLANDSNSDSERYAFTKAKRAVLAGEIETVDAAAYRIHSVFAGNVKQPTVRIAYIENPRHQSGEPYQLCPKARHQIGNAIPMPISSCRDNCIDSRVTQDGQVSCAYQDWLKTAADNHINVISRLDEVHPETNNRLNIKEGERFNPESLAIDAMNFEQRMQEKLKAIKGTKKTNLEDNIETKLDDKKIYNRHQGLVGEGNMENRLRKPVVASHTGIDASEEISFSAQLEAKRKKLYVDEQVEQRLDEASEPNLGHHGEPTERIQDVNIKKAWNASKTNAIESDSEDNLGVQVETRHEADLDNDQTIEELLADAEHYYDDEEMEALLSTLEELLGKSHKGY
jgi:hypothetical protein